MKSRLPIAATLISSALVAGCASTPTSKFSAIGAPARALLRDSASYDLQVVPGKGLAHYTGAEQAMMTTGMLFGAIGGAIGAGAAIASANKRGATLMQQDGLSDPAQVLADKFRGRLEALGKAQAADAPMRFQASTSNWTLAKGALAYFATLKVVDQRGATLASGECKYVRNEQQLGISIEGMLADKGAGLKRQSENAAEFCAQYFQGVLFPGAAGEPASAR